MMADDDVVLVVEDEEEARTFLVEILKHEGFNAIGFANGLEALEYLQQAEPPRLIVLDLRMPVMDGPRFRAAQLSDPRLAKIPVVVVTALEPSAAVGLSPLRIFRKPVDVQGLIKVVRENC
jgi:CheY-like chemotaxis protein